APAAVRRRLEAVLRRCGGVLVVAGDWDGAQARLLVTRQEWAGIEPGHGRLRARRGAGGGGRPGGGGRARGRGGWVAGPGGAAGPGWLGGPGGPDGHGDAGHRVTAPSPVRVLVLWCPDWPLDPAAARAFERVVSGVEELCPRVEVLHPGACAIGARGPARYFGGEGALAGEIIETVTGGGLPPPGRAARRGVSPPAAPPAGGPAAAPAGAPRPGAGGPAPRPVSVLDSEELTELLPRLGIVTLGDFARLP